MEIHQPNPVGAKRGLLEGTGLGGNSFNKLLIESCICGEECSGKLTPRPFRKDQMLTFPLVFPEINLTCAEVHPCFQLIEWVVSRATIAGLQLGWVSNWV